MEIVKVNRPHESYIVYVTPGVKVEVHTQIGRASCRERVCHNV